jgi:lipopolysaccharide/colanic/teichoic acid biosynthesis glycosyltransferase
LDVLVAVVALVFLIPLTPILAVLIAMDGGPVLFRHLRVGKDGRTFYCLKFRTMVLGANDFLDEYLSYHEDELREWESSRKLRFDPRTTAIGRVLRKSSLDELPQLINVLRGDMSLVGPRPVTEQELALYGSSAAVYTAVRPGITGPWQISGRNDVSYETRIKMDVDYVFGRSFIGDLIILLHTPANVWSGKGAR